tara:strand:- start:754 stop:975 length:222 start_codon:yes stop_codon:yes gene_type:complete
MILTKNQKKVYVYVQKYIDRHGFSPTLTEISKHMKFKYRSEAHIVIDKLCKLRLIKKNMKKKIRNLTIIKEKK